MSIYRYNIIIGDGKKMYKDYVFDLYGTLVDINTDEEKMSLWKKMALFLGYYGANYKPAELKKAYYELVKKDESKLKNALVNEEKPRYAHEAFPEIQIEYIFQKLFKQKGVKCSMQLAIHAGQFFRVTSTKYIKLYEGVEELLKGIKANGGRVWLLSNAQRIFTEYEMRYLGIYDLFDGILISSDEGTRKPDLRFFGLLEEKFDVDFKNTIMIGNDANSDIGGARKTGMDTFFIYSNISPMMTEDEIKAVEATYKLDTMDLFKVKEMLGV